MEIFGKVLAILDQTKILVRIKKSQFVSDGMLITVFAEVQDPATQEFGLEKLFIPKGDLRIIVQQTADIYIAERFQSERVEKRRKPSSLMLNPLRDYLEEEIVKPGDWSAFFDRSQSLNLAYSKDIKVGDLVGVK